MSENSNPTSPFVARHIGPSLDEQSAMLSVLGCKSIEELTERVVPKTIALKDPFKLSRYQDGLTEPQALARLQEIADKNQLWRNFIGLGYYGTHVPGVIKRNILENPGWYTQYTPYQAEISQGRLEALLNFQTMVADLTALPIANASLLDEGTAAAEAMAMSLAIFEGNQPQNKNLKFFISSEVFPQTIAVVRTRAAALGVAVEVGDHRQIKLDSNYMGALLQYPGSSGEIFDYAEFVRAAHSANVLVTVAADILALALLTAPGEFGADIAVGSTQRFGVPLGFGGPHAGYIATKDEFKRLLPGRIVGVSKDARGRPALRLALQTREQHIRREKATSNICTAQVLLAVMAGMYGVYHGPKGIKAIAQDIFAKCSRLIASLRPFGVEAVNSLYFDTVTFKVKSASDVMKRAAANQVNVRKVNDTAIALSLDETTTTADLELLCRIISGENQPKLDASTVSAAKVLPSSLLRTSSYLTAESFNRYHSETEMLRYIKRLESKDLSLTASMIPLGSCTMKLNASSEMFPVSWPQFSSLHPFAPDEQTLGYRELFKELEGALCDITGFDEVSLQPNAGSQGEYAGLLAIRGYFDARGESSRRVCLIPKSAHGTNPASAVMAGFEVVAVECDANGNVSIESLKTQLSKAGDRLASLMLTYPSTHGVFEEQVVSICELVHQSGGQVYMDGANLNAIVGLAKPALIGADVCHINLHKTFCIPHGGGGPGMGPIGVRKHLAAYLPSHPLAKIGPGDESNCVISAAPWGSASILVISWMYIAMMGAAGLRRASQVAILNANYLARKLEQHYPVLFKGSGGFVAHEAILDLRGLKKSAAVEVEDVAKRLMDYGFHAPTVSWPVAGTLMVEPTESESKAELDRFCDAMTKIAGEVQQIAKGTLDKSNNPLKHAPHTALDCISDNWDRPYSRELAAFPVEGLRSFKFWPAVNRIDSVYGDKNLFCTCSHLMTDEVRKE